MRWVAVASLLLLAGNCAFAAGTTTRVERTISLRHAHKLIVDGIVKLRLTHQPGRAYVKIAGPAEAVANAAVSESGDTVRLLVAGTGELAVHVNSGDIDSVSFEDTASRPTAARGCVLVLNGSSRTQLGSIIGNIVEIYVDGGARLDVEKLSAGSIEAHSNGDGRVRLSH